MYLYKGYLNVFNICIHRSIYKYNVCVHILTHTHTHTHTHSHSRNSKYKYGLRQHAVVLLYM